MEERIIKYFNQELSASERKKLIDEVKHNDVLKNDFIEYNNLLGLLALTRRLQDEKEGKENLKSFKRKHKNHSSRRLALRVINYAAIFILLLTTTWFMVNYLRNDTPTPVELAYNTLHVPIGQRANLTLSDGTEVWLNAGSSLKYPVNFNQTERKVSLSGEAYFNVVKNNTPFIVSSSSLDIKVLGTIFNVSDYKKTDITEISLIEGVVEVYKPYDKTNAIRLEANQVLTYKNDSMHISGLRNEDDFLWKEGVYAFKNASLLDIVKKLELYFDVKIIVKKSSILKYTYTGKFRQRDGVMEILRILQNIHKFKIEKDEVNNIIILK